MGTMEENTRLLVCLGAAVAANCIPCFEYYYEKAQATGLAQADIQEVVELAHKIKNNINMLMKTSARDLIGPEGGACPLAGGKSIPPCI
jgi:alkylhydroperoxidase/carboxymuconolactone decarboxylase family protein YurZ